MRYYITTLFLAAISYSSLAADKPRVEVEGEPPGYEVTCAAGAVNAKDCKVDPNTYAGWRTYKIECQQCHGGGGLGSTFAPNVLDRINKEGVDFGRFLYVIDNGYKAQVGVMPPLKKNPRVQKNKAALYAYLRARAEGALPIGRPAKRK